MNNMSIGDRDQARIQRNLDRIATAGGDDDDQMAYLATEGLGGVPQNQAPSRQTEEPNPWTNTDPTLNPLEATARIGRYFNQGAQRAADRLAEKGGMPGAVAGTVLGTASEFLLPQNQLAAAGTLLPTAIKAASLFGKAPVIGPRLAKISGKATSDKGFLAQALQAGPKIPPRFGSAVVKNPDILTKAQSVEQASSGYAKAVGGLAGKVRSIGERLGKTVLSEGDYTEAVNRAGELFDKGRLTPKDALEGVQSINRLIRNKRFTQSMDDEQMRAVGELREGLLDFLQNNGTPEIRNAGRRLFEAHAKEAFSNVLPQNKYGSADALRTWAVGGMALAKTGAALAAGNPLAAVPAIGVASMFSPYAVGKYITNAASASKTLSKGAHVPIVNYASEALTDARNRRKKQSTIKP